MSMILAGDIGGTKTVLALFQPNGDTLQPVREATFPSREHATFEEILGTFLEGSPGSRPEAACFGVAGAVMDGRVQTTNLPWTLEEEVLAGSIGARKATLLNDLEAAAYGTLHLSLEEKHVLNPGTSRRKRGNIAVIAAGTGLGEAILKVTMAREACAFVRDGASPRQAAVDAVGLLRERAHGEGGIIVAGPDGRLGWAFNTARMSRALIREGMSSAKAAV